MKAGWFGRQVALAKKDVERWPDYLRPRNDNVDEHALREAVLACPCHCASKEDLRISIAAYLAKMNESKNQ
jgi:hypothetical protein